MELQRNSKSKRLTSSGLRGTDPCDPSLMGYVLFLLLDDLLLSFDFELYGAGTAVSSAIEQFPLLGLFHNLLQLLSLQDCLRNVAPE